MSVKNKIILFSCIGIFILGGAFLGGFLTASNRYKRELADLQRTAKEYKQLAESTGKSLDGLGGSLRTIIDNLTTAQGLADKSTTITDRIRIISRGFKEAIKGLRESLQYIPDRSGS